MKTTKSKRSIQGIRWLNNDSINAVQGLMEKKAREFYRSDYIDCEVQMLAKTCNAVKEFEKNKEKKKMQSEWDAMAKVESFNKRYSKSKPIPLGERKNIKTEP